LRIQRPLAPKRRKNKPFIHITTHPQFYAPSISTAIDEDGVTSYGSDLQPSTFLYNIGSHGPPTADGYIQPVQTHPEAKTWLSCENQDEEWPGDLEAEGTQGKEVPQLVIIDVWARASGCD